MVEQLSIYASKGSQDPAVYVSEALSWIDANWASWWALVNMCEKEANDPARIVYKTDANGGAVLSEDGKPIVDHIVRIRRGDLYLIAQMRGMRISLCRDFRFNNNTFAALSRYMLMVRPAIAKVIHPAENPEGIDSISHAAAWRGFKWSHRGRAAIHFPAERWQDAIELVELGDVSAA